MFYVNGKKLILSTSYLLFFCVCAFMYIKYTRVFACKQAIWISCMSQIKMSSLQAHFHSHLSADLF